MEWVDAVRLDRYVEKQLGEPNLILEVARKFAGAVKTLNESNAAHGDLQHGNILVSTNGDLRFVDYDECMFLLWLVEGATNSGIPTINTQPELRITSGLILTTSQRG